MLEDLSCILYHESTVLSRLDELARQITADYRSRELAVVAVLNGSFMFMGDLLRRIPLPLRVDCLSVNSYIGDKSSSIVTFDQLTMPAIAGRDVLVLDDILDSGHTLHAVRARLLAEGPRSIKTCVLLRKCKVRAKEIEADYVGFDIADEFVVGYGLDFMERYRNLPCIGVLSGEVIREGLNRIAAVDSATASGVGARA
jgi:hypoxanthine phosphoribosyltransferase